MGDKKEMSGKIEELKKRNERMQEELEQTIAFYEVWKSFVNASEVKTAMENHGRAILAFNVVQTALLREVVIGLTKIWDKSKGTIKMAKFKEELRNGELVDCIAKLRLGRIDTVDGQGLRKLMGPHMNAVEMGIRAKICEVVSGVEAYEDGNEGKELKKIRDGFIAHRNMACEFAQLSDVGILKKCIEETVAIAKNIESVLNRVSFDFSTTAYKYEDAANDFWSTF
ncbi:hypothetical protein [Chromobacterium violaceum]|uniref:AbiU2 domain-containing protein n=1 Tax=Chromobacterium violaceum TaxID=536 RepID=UPI001124EE30|nr:hypothetical protein [Chromobacterium violaceum]